LLDQQQQQQQQQQQVPVGETVHSSRYQRPSLLHPKCGLSSSAAYNVMRHADVGRSVTPPSHYTVSEVTPSRPYRPPPHRAPLHRLDVDMTDSRMESSQLNNGSQQVNDNVDIGVIKSDLPATDVMQTTPTYWTRHKSLSLPSRQ